MLGGDGVVEAGEHIDGPVAGNASVEHHERLGREPVRKFDHEPARIARLGAAARPPVVVRSSTRRASARDVRSGGPARPAEAPLFIAMRATDPLQTCYTSSVGLGLGVSPMRRREFIALLGDSAWLRSSAKRWRCYVS